MSWVFYLGDTTTGLIDCPIDIPSVSWSMTVSDSSLSTTKERGVGEENVSSLTIPWSAVPGDTPARRSSALSSYRRYLCMCWRDDDTDQNSPGVPYLIGSIGKRKDTLLDTSFSLDSFFSLLQNRLVVPEKTYGKGQNGTTNSTVRLENLSYRGIACAIGDLCTNQKPGGTLPIDWTYLGEKGTRAREYTGFDIQNNSGYKLLTNLTNLVNGPDIQFRPYLYDSSHFRVQFIAGSDSDQRLGQSTVHRLTCFPGGGTLQNVTVDRDGPIMRVYGSGSGTDQAQICYLAEDLSLVKQTDPYPLVELAYSDSDTDNLDVLKSHSNSRLEANSVPIMQVSGEIHFNDKDTPKPGSLWPGEMVEVAIDGFPTLPDGIYKMRIMQISGDQTDKATVKFDVYADPLY